MNKVLAIECNNGKSVTKYVLELFVFRSKVGRICTPKQSFKYSA